MAEKKVNKGITRTVEEKIKEKQVTFIRVVTPRVTKALKAIKLIGNCSASNYVFSPEQVIAIIAALRDAVQNIANAFDKKVDKQQEFSLPQ